MGTRCLTVVLEEVWEDPKKPKKKAAKREECLVMYRQFDGYPDGHGKELAEFLAGSKPTNGLAGMNSVDLFNGAGCMAASIVCHFKQQKDMVRNVVDFKEVANPNAHKPTPGAFYLHPSGTRDVGEEYIYYVEICGKEKESFVQMTVCEAAWTEKDWSAANPLKGQKPKIVAEHDEHVLWVGEPKDFGAWLEKRKAEKEATAQEEAKEKAGVK